MTSKEMAIFIDKDMLHNLWLLSLDKPLSYSEKMIIVEMTLDRKGKEK